MTDDLTLPVAFVLLFLAVTGGIGIGLIVGIIGELRK